MDYSSFAVFGGGTEGEPKNIFLLLPRLILRVPIRFSTNGYLGAAELLREVEGEKNGVRVLEVMLLLVRVPRFRYCRGSLVTFQAANEWRSL